MLYALAHAVTDTDMSENDLPTWVDVVGGACDGVTVVGLLYAATLL